MKVLDEKALRTELATAVASDRRRKAVDEMKKRSILTAGSYDEFRHLVKCAENDQKPLTTKEMMAVNGTARLGEEARSKFPSMTAHKSSSGGSYYFNSREQREKEQSSNFVNSVKLNLSVPKNAQDFDRAWRRNCRTMGEKFHYLINIPVENIPNIFKVELNELGSIVHSLNYGLQSIYEKFSLDRDESLQEQKIQTAKKVLNFLETLSQTKSFKFALDFLSKGEKKYVQEAFNRIQLLFSANEDETELDTLRSRYNV